MICFYSQVTHTHTHTSIHTYKHTYIHRVAVSNINLQGMVNDESKVIIDVMIELNHVNHIEKEKIVVIF